MAIVPLPPEGFVVLDAIGQPEGPEIRAYTQPNEPGVSPEGELAWGEG
jgi:hypothetical protein